MLRSGCSSLRITLQTWLPVVMSFAFVSSMSLAQADDAEARPVQFHSDIVPILKTKCQACHGGNVHEADLWLDNYEKVIAGGSAGPVVVAGDAEKSLLYRVVAHLEEPHMPPMPNDLKIAALTSQERDLFKRWINKGAVEGKKTASEMTRFRSLSGTRRQIYSLSLSPDQRWLAASQANQVLLYDLLTGKRVTQLQAPSLDGAVDHDYVQAVSFSPQGDRIATGGYRNVKLWKRDAPRAIASRKFEHPVKRIRLNSERTQLALLLEDSEIAIWNLESPQESGVIPAGESAIIDFTFSSSGNGIILARSNSHVEWRDAQNGTLSRTVPMPSPVTALQTHSVDATLITAHEDNAVRVWSPEALDRGESNSVPEPIQVLAGLSQPAHLLSVAPDQSRLWTASPDGTIKAWDLKKGATVWTKTAASPVTFLSSTDDGSRLVFAGVDGTLHLHDADGTLIASVRAAAAFVRDEQDQAIAVEVAQRRLNRASEKLQQTERDLTDRKTQYQNALDEIRQSAESLEQAEMKLATADQAVTQAEKQLEADPEQATFKLALTEAQMRQKKESEAVEAARAALQSAKRTASQAEQSLQFGTEQVHRRRSLQEKMQAELEAAQRQVAAAIQQRERSGQSISDLTIQQSCGVLLATGSGEAVRAWNLKSGSPLDGPGFAGASPRHLVATKGDHIVTIDHRGTAVLWDTAPAWSYETTLGPPDHAPQNLDNSAMIHRVNALAFSPDGKWIGTAGGDPSRAGEVLLWELAQPSQPIEFPDAHSDTVLDIRFSRDGQELVTGGADKFCKLFDVQNRSLVKSFEGHTEHVQGVALSADELLLATAGADRLLKIWDVETGELIRTIDNSSRPLTSASFVGSSDRVLSSSGDGHVKVHVAQSGQNERSFVGAQDYVYAAMASADGALVLAGGEDGVIRVWNGKTGEQIYAITEPIAGQEVSPQ